MVMELAKEEDCQRLEELVEANPGDGLVRYELALLLWNNTLPQQVAEHFVAAAKLNPQNAATFRYLGDYYCRRSSGGRTTGPRSTASRSRPTTTTGRSRAGPDCSRRSGPRGSAPGTTGWGWRMAVEPSRRASRTRWPRGRLEATRFGPGEVVDALSIVSNNASSANPPPPGLRSSTWTRPLPRIPKF